MNKIIEVNPLPNHFSITWFLGDLCNYDCMYCPSEVHNNTNTHNHDLATMKSVWRNIDQKAKKLGLKYKISFTGGEVTANKNFLPLLKWLRENYHDIEFVGISTNGSASVNYLKTISKYVDSISFSTHSEFMDESKFFKKVLVIDRLMIRPEKSLHVNIMDEYWNQSRTPLYTKWLLDHNISFSITKIDYSKKISIHPMIKGNLNIESIN